MEIQNASDISVIQLHRRVHVPSQDLTTDIIEGESMQVSNSPGQRQILIRKHSVTNTDGEEEQKYQNQQAMNEMSKINSFGQIDKIISKASQETGKERGQTQSALTSQGQLLVVPHVSSKLMDSQKMSKNTRLMETQNFSSHDAGTSLTHENFSNTQQLQCRGIFPRDEMLMSGQQSNSLHNSLHDVACGVGIMQNPNLQGESHASPSRSRPSSDSRSVLQNDYQYVIDDNFKLQKIPISKMAQTQHNSNYSTAQNWFRHKRGSQESLPKSNDKLANTQNIDEMKVDNNRARTSQGGLLSHPNQGRSNAPFPVRQRIMANSRGQIPIAIGNNLSHKAFVKNSEISVYDNQRAWTKTSTNFFNSRKQKNLQTQYNALSNHRQSVDYAIDQQQRLQPIMQVNKQILNPNSRKKYDPDKMPCHQNVFITKEMGRETVTVQTQVKTEKCPSDPAQAFVTIQSKNIVNHQLDRTLGIKCDNSSDLDSKYRNGMPAQFKPRKKIYQNITLINYKNRAGQGARMNSDDIGMSKFGQRNKSVDVEVYEKQAISNKHVSHTQYFGGHISGEYGVQQGRKDCYVETIPMFNGDIKELNLTDRETDSNIKNIIPSGQQPGQATLGHDTAMSQTLIVGKEVSNITRNNSDLEIQQKFEYENKVPLYHEEDDAKQLESYVKKDKEDMDKGRNNKSESKSQISQEFLFSRQSKQSRQQRKRVSKKQEYVMKNISIELKNGQNEAQVIQNLIQQSNAFRKQDTGLSTLQGAKFEHGRWTEGTEESPLIRDRDSGLEAAQMFEDKKQFQAAPQLTFQNYPIVFRKPQAATDYNESAAQATEQRSVPNNQWVGQAFKQNKQSFGNAQGSSSPIVEEATNDQFELSGTHLTQPNDTLMQNQNSSLLSSDDYSQQQNRNINQLYASNPYQSVEETLEENKSQSAQSGKQRQIIKINQEILDKTENKSRTIDLRLEGDRCDATVTNPHSTKSQRHGKQEIQSALLKGEDGELSNDHLDPKIKDKEVIDDDYNAKIKTSKEEMTHLPPTFALSKSGTRAPQTRVQSTFSFADPQNQNDLNEDLLAEPGDNNERNSTQRSKRVKDKGVKDNLQDLNVPKVTQIKFKEIDANGKNEATIQPYMIKKTYKRGQFKSFDINRKYVGNSNQSYAVLKQSTFQLQFANPETSQHGNQIDSATQSSKKEHVPPIQYGGIFMNQNIKNKNHHSNNNSKEDLSTKNNWYTQNSQQGLIKFKNRALPKSQSLQKRINLNNMDQIIYQQNQNNLMLKNHVVQQQEYIQYVQQQLDYINTLDKIDKMKAQTLLNSTRELEKNMAGAVDSKRQRNQFQKDHGLLPLKNIHSTDDTQIQQQSSSRPQTRGQQDDLSQSPGTFHMKRNSNQKDMASTQEGFEMGNTMNQTMKRTRDKDNDVDTVPNSPALPIQNIQVKLNPVVSATTNLLSQSVIEVATVNDLIPKQLNEFPTQKVIKTENVKIANFNNKAKSITKQGMIEQAITRGNIQQEKSLQLLQKFVNSSKSPHKPTVIAGVGKDYEPYHVQKQNKADKASSCDPENKSKEEIMQQLQHKQNIIKKSIQLLNKKNDKKTILGEQNYSYIQTVIGSQKQGNILFDRFKTQSQGGFRLNIFTDSKNAIR